MLMTSEKEMRMRESDEKTLCVQVWIQLYSHDCSTIEGSHNMGHTLYAYEAHSVRIRAAAILVSFLHTLYTEKKTSMADFVDDN